MSKILMRDFCDNELKTNVVRQFGRWSDFCESASDICNYGASGGVSGFIYYSDTIEFFDKNNDQIIEKLYMMADDFGYHDELLSDGFLGLKPEVIGKLVSSFNSYDGLDSHTSNTMMISDIIFSKEHYPNKHYEESDVTQFKNICSWFALEEVARELYDLQES